MTASSLVCAFVSAASVATMAMVVFSPGRPFEVGASAAGGTAAGHPNPPNAPSPSHGAAQNCGPWPTLALPQAFTAARAPTAWPSRVVAEADPSPPLRLTVVAPKPAPAVPSANVSPASEAAA